MLRQSLFSPRTRFRPTSNQRTAYYARDFTSTCRRSLLPGQTYGKLIRTLDPSKMVKANQALMDLSGLKQPVVHVARYPDSILKPPLYFVKDKISKPIPFPPDTRGVFYFHHNPAYPILSGGIRFRICETQAKFTLGRDLQLPGGLGLPWEMPLLSFHGEKTQPVRDLLVRDGLVEPEVLKDVQKIKFRGLRSLYGVKIFFLGQPKGRHTSQDQPIVR
ncbi:hypothetical protein CPB83DRAFT_153326 [Crepidotus variabilis]|uniref:Uncharacterized protein n=1 Tax=Crepidotus variabilis TaxID=179855 RepID=A0A9P6ELA8_9AGAR|nr:hypothetical protein CPB83DRAFT_153326 [Crepidotus variabilis]